MIELLENLEKLIKFFDFTISQNLAEMLAKFCAPIFLHKNQLAV